MDCQEYHEVCRKDWSPFNDGYIACLRTSRCQFSNEEIFSDPSIEHSWKMSLKDAYNAELFYASRQTRGWDAISQLADVTLWNQENHYFRSALQTCQSQFLNPFSPGYWFGIQCLDKRWQEWDWVLGPTSWITCPVLNQVWCHYDGECLDPETHCSGRKIHWYQDCTQMFWRLPWQTETIEL